MGSATCERRDFENDGRGELAGSSLGEDWPYLEVRLPVKTRQRRTGWWKVGLCSECVGSGGLVHPLHYSSSSAA